MKHRQVDESLCGRLDTWLGTRRPAVRKHLSPLQFSLDSGIDEETATHLFALCTDIGLLRTRYTVECPGCSSILGNYYSPGEIPESMYCPECGSNVLVGSGDVAVWFELLREPERF
ncbi:hypothetical protein [Desulfofundulus sp.]|uniref:hypothetical protein n=1 Tax=Desulfofundulus sp. TaxID=2282750 RepID=UPI003C76715E